MATKVETKDKLDLGSNNSFTSIGKLLTYRSQHPGGIEGNRNIYSLELQNLNHLQGLIFPIFLEMLEMGNTLHMETLPTTLATVRTN